jgi:hypothetical protein
MERLSAFLPLQGMENILSRLKSRATNLVSPKGKVYPNPMHGVGLYGN